MKISIQIEFLRNYFNTKNIVDESTKHKMSNVDMNRIRKVINTKKKDGCTNVSNDFTVQLKQGTVIIKDAD